MMTDIMVALIRSATVLTMFVLLLGAILAVVTNPHFALWEEELSNERN